MWARWLVMLAAISGCDQVWGLERPPEIPPATGTWRAVTSGGRHTCGIRDDGTLWCWGSDEFGQIAVDDRDSTVPVQIGASTWLEVSGRGSHTCAIAEDGSLWCWGDNNYNQLGVGNGGHAGLNRIAGGPWAHVATATTHTCAIAADTTLWCWGDNSYGELGDDTTAGRSTPAPVSSAARDRWRSVSLGVSHTCGIRDDDSLWCFGQAYYGALADPNLPSSAAQSVPNRARGSWTKVAAGNLHTCAISGEGRLRCWGYNASGELGDGTTSGSAIGVDVGGAAARWVDLVAGADHNCAVRTSGELYCWGDNTHGQIPNPDVGEIASTPVAIAPRLAAWTGAHGLGLTHSCLIDAEQRLACVGGNSAGQLGRGSGPHPRPVKLDGEWVDVASAEAFTCALDANRDAYCWGNSSYAALGDGTQRSRQVPTMIAEPGPWDSISAGGNAACAKRGTARWCWGQNANQQLGYPGGGGVLYLPKMLDDDHFPQAMRAHLCSIRGGSMWCWGAGGRGQLGFGDTASKALPTLLASPSGAWTHVGVGNQHTCAATTTAVFCWGYNEYGQVGNNTSGDLDMPTRILDGAYEAIAVGYESACAIREGAASCWGFGGYGSLGTGALISEHAPRAIAGSWKAIAMAEAHSCGIATDGSLWCWGDNAVNRVGDGTAERRLAPVQIDASPGWEKLALGQFHGCALKADHTLWCWGGNGTGQVGDGTSWSTDLQPVD